MLSVLRGTKKEKKKEKYWLCLQGAYNPSPLPLNWLSHQVCQWKVANYFHFQKNPKKKCVKLIRNKKSKLSQHTQRNWLFQSSRSPTPINLKCKVERKKHNAQQNIWLLHKQNLPTSNIYNFNISTQSLRYRASFRLCPLTYKDNSESTPQLME